MDVSSAFKKLDLSLHDIEKALEHSIFAVTDPDGVIVYANPAFCNISKYSEDEIIGQHIDILKSDEHSDEFFEELWTELKSGKTWEGELKNRSKDGSFYWIHSTITPIFDNNKQIRNYVLINKDITKEKRITEQLLDIEEKLRKQNESLTQQIKDQSAELVRSERLATIGTMSSRIAHDLKNPLTVMQTYSDMLTPEILEYLNAADRDKWFRIQTSITDMQRIIEDVLDFARTTELKKSKTSLLKILKLSLNHIKTPFGIQINIPDKDVKIKCDARKMEAVFSNLISNSVSALDGTGEIDVTFSSDAGTTIINFKDSGPGIPEENIDRIFEPLYTTKKTGTGLGLVICKSIVEQHGGTIEFSNKPTTFTITLPNK